MSIKRKVVVTSFTPNDGNFHYVIDTLRAIDTGARHSVSVDDFDHAISAAEGGAELSDIMTALVKIYAMHYQGNPADLVGAACIMHSVSIYAGVTYEVLPEKYIFPKNAGEKATPVELPTDADLAYIEEQAGKSELTWLATGDANFYRLINDGNWFGVLRLNGEMSVVKQEEFLNSHFKKGTRAALKTIEQVREEFEANAESMGFDIERQTHNPSGEPWGEYLSLNLGHRWAGYLFALGIEL